MNIKFRKGTHRAALVLGPITLKFVHPRWGFIRNLFDGIGKVGYFERLKDNWNILSVRIIKAVFANITEFLTWKRLKPSFLAPTYFSCGFFNIQKTIAGEGVECLGLMRKVIESLPESRRSVWNFVEAHTVWFNSGWVKTKRGYILFDYGDSFMEGWPFSNVLRRNRKELEMILSSSDI